MPADLTFAVVTNVTRASQDAHVGLELRVTNVTSRPVVVPVDGFGGRVEVLDPTGRQISPPPGAPKYVKNPVCEHKSCASAPHAEVTLAPGGVMRVKVRWIVERTRWPVGEKEPCCSFGPPRTEAAGPLALGKYRVRVVAPIGWSLGAARSAEVEIEVIK